MRRVGQGLVGAAILIAAITVVARIVGFLRVVVLAHTVGTTCLGDVYTTANAIPNIVYEVVVGGALAAAVVPLVAASVARNEPAMVRQTVAALHGWSLMLLVPVTALTYLVSGPLVAGLLGSSYECADQLMHSTAQQMLWVFALQIPVYGATVVAQGALQAHRRFVAPAVAPLLSSLVVIGAYLGYARIAGDGRGSLASLDTAGFLVLSVGTTLGVAVLLLAQIPSLHRQGLLVRPSLRFPAGVAAPARVLAVSGLVAVAAQWLAYAVAIRLANVHGPEGAVVVLTLAWTVFMLPWAVLVFPVATSVFPELSAQFGRGDGEAFAATTAWALRSVVLLAGLGGAGLAAVAEPAARLMVSGVPGQASVATLSAALLAFAPGVLGYGMQGYLVRVLAARHASQVAAAVSVAGWALGSVLAVAFTVTAGSGQPQDVIARIAAGLSAGMLLMGGALVVAVRRTSGAAAVAGLSRTFAATLLAAVSSVAVGRLLVTVLPGAGTAAALVETVLVSLVVLVVYAGLAAVVDVGTARQVAARFPALAALRR